MVRLFRVAEDFERHAFRLATGQLYDFFEEFAEAVDALGCFGKRTTSLLNWAYALDKLGDRLIPRCEDTFCCLLDVVLLKVSNLTQPARN